MRDILMTLNIRLFELKLYLKKRLISLHLVNGVKILCCVM